MKRSKFLPLIFFLLAAFNMKAQFNYVHTVTTMPYSDLANDIPLHGTDSIPASVLLSLDFRFPAYGSYTDFKYDPSTFLGGALVSRNGYVAGDEMPGYLHTHVYHAFLTNLRRIDSASVISVEAYGVPGNRYAKFQWKHMGLEGRQDTEEVNFQIWFNESDQSISYHYGPSFLNLTRAFSPVIGLLRAENNFSSFTHATYLKGNTANPQALTTYRPTSFSTMIPVIGFPPEGTVITFKSPFGVGTGTVLQNQQMELYPNPASQQVYIRGCKGSWQLFDLVGSVRASGQNPSAGISLEGLPSGTYFVQTTSPEGQVCRSKFMKQ